MKNCKKYIALMLTSIFVSCSVQDISAAAPVVTYDESVYVNLDYYGGISDMSIVKSCSLNGNSEFTDYGEYESVSNMSGYSEPEFIEDGVYWKLNEETTGRFYFEAKPKDMTQIPIPWNFDVSYKLNGVPTKAEELAGASGLIEIDISVQANNNVPKYYRNNMLLQVATMVDMEDCYSVEAPGSQLQSVGTYKAIVFAAVPGESTDFTIRVGTDSFESSGVVFMIIPATLSQLKDIKDLKEARDTVQDSADALHKSLNDVLGTIESMSEGLKATQEGMSGLNEVREALNNAKDRIYDSTDISTENIIKMVEDLNNLMPYFEDAKNFVNDVNDTVNDIVDLNSEVSEQLELYTENLKKLQQDSVDLRGVLSDLDSQSDSIMQVLQKSSDSLEGLAASLGGYTNISQGLGGLIGSIEDPELQAGILGSLSNISSKAYDISANASDATYYLGRVMSETRKTIKILDEGNEPARNFLRNFNSLTDSVIESFETIDDLIAYIDRLNDTLNYNKPIADDLNDSCRTVLQDLSRGLSSAVLLIKTFENVAQENDDALNESTEILLNGMIDILQKGIEGINDTKSIRDASDTIKNTIDEQIDKFEDDTNLLEVDPEHFLVSFTSDKNPYPESTQILLRTKEISIDDEKVDFELEHSEDNGTILSRIQNIFIKIYNAVKSIFVKE